MKQNESWQYTKGMTLSYVALATALIKSETITAEELIEELDAYINIFTEHHPDSVAIIETMQMVKDTILNLYPDGHTSSTPLPFGWVSNFIGNA